MGLKRKRATINGNLSLFANYIAALGKDFNVFDLRARLARFEPLLDKYETIQNEIEDRTAEPEGCAAEVKEWTIFEDAYFASILKACRIIEHNTAPHATSRRDAAENDPKLSELDLNLPALSIDRFDGTYGDYIRLRDTKVVDPRQ